MVSQFTTNQPQIGTMRARMAIAASFVLINYARVRTLIGVILDVF